MTDHMTGTQEEWIAARLQLLEAEKELTRRSDELARKRQELPWWRIDKDYRFDTEEGEALARRPLPRPFAASHLPLHVRPRLGRRLPELLGARRRLRRDTSPPPEPRRRLHRRLACFARTAALVPGPDGWSFPWVSSGRTDFNYDFHVTIDASVAPVEYNYRNQAQLEQANVAWREWSGEQPGMSAFALQGGDVYHTYSAYARGLDALWTMWQWLDRAPLGRNEGDVSWFHRHDQYGTSYR